MFFWGALGDDVRKKRHGIHAASPLKGIRLDRTVVERDGVVRDPVREFVDSLPGPMLGGLVGIVYLGLSQFVIWLNDPVNLGAGFWPAAGFSLALLLLLPTRKWGWVLGAVAAAELGGDLVHGYPLDAALMWTAGNVVEPLLGALLIKRFSSADGTLVPLQKLMGFLLFGVILAPLVGATIGSLGTVLFIGMPASEVWPKYFAGDALGVLVMAPMILAWKGPGNARSWTERLLLGGSLALASIAVFSRWGGVWEETLPYVMRPLLIWAALRFGIRGAAIAGFTVANVANWATAISYGPFATDADVAINLLQVFLGTTIATGLVVAALMSDLTDRHEIGRVLATHNAELRTTLEELERSQLRVRKLEGILPICMSCKAVRSDDDREWIPLDRYLSSSKAVSLSHTYCPSCNEDLLKEMPLPAEA